VFRLEAVTDDDEDGVDFGDESRSTMRRRTDQPHHADTSTFNHAGASSSSPFTVDAAAMTSFMRSVSEPDVDVQSTSSLYENYAQLPRSRRRRHQQPRRRPFDEDVGGCSPSLPHLYRRDDDGGDRDAAPSPRRASRHRRTAPGQQVSSSFENLVGGLLAVPPQAQCRRHLANSAETSSAAVKKAASTSSDLCGRGADFPPAMAAFVETGASITGSRVRPSSLPADLVLPLRAKHAPQHVRRAKHLFKSCQLCVRRRGSDDAAMT